MKKVTGSLVFYEVESVKEVRISQDCGVGYFLHESRGETPLHRNTVQSISLFDQVG